MSAKPLALLDSNVVVAALAQAHEHHAAALVLFAQWPAHSFAVAAHAYAEAYAVLTRPAAGAPFRWPAEEAWATLESVAGVTRLVGLTHGQTFDAIRAYAAAGGVGSRLYDKLIGEVAVQNGISCIITFNTRHMAGLFGALRVMDPANFATTNGREGG